jgi:hypothetical protein
MLYFVVYGNTNVIFLTVREYREYQCYLFDCTGIPGIPMLSFVDKKDNIGIPKQPKKITLVFPFNQKR